MNTKVEITYNDGSRGFVGTGAIRSLPDRRDYNDRHEEIQYLTDLIGVVWVTAEELPEELNLVYNFPPIKDQGSLGSCTAFGSNAILEYMIYKATGRFMNLSEIFLYNTTRWVLGWFGSGDTGAHVRSTIAAIRTFGLPLDKYWPYNVDKLDQRPDPEVYSMATNFNDIVYFRHDAGENTPPACALLSAKKYLAAKIPFTFAFYGFTNFNKGSRDGDVPMPGPNDSALWGHCVCAAGYDDNYTIMDKETGNKTVGAILFRNSWGPNWGQNGYGWIPYDYFYRSYCFDMWSILSAEWLDMGDFGM